MAHDIEFFKAKTTLASTALAAALGLALGLAAAPAMADPVDDFGCHTHKDCDTGGDPPTVPNPAIVYQITLSDIKRSIAIANDDGSNEIIFESNSGVSYRTPTWSRDGNSILLAATCPLGYGIYRVSFDRTALATPPSVACPDLELITTFPAPSFLNNSQPMESLDESMIAYSGDGPPNGSGVVGNNEIFIVPDDGSGGTSFVNVTESLDVAETFPSWSPDGTRLAVRTSFEDDDPDTNIFFRDVAIIRIGPDMKEISRASLLDALAISEPSSPLTNVGTSITSVMWSNTGGPTNLVALAALDDIWILEFEITPGSDCPGTDCQDILEDVTALNLTNNGSSIRERRPTWSPDDSALLYRGSGASGCGDGKRVYNEFVIVDSALQQPPDGCVGSVILSVKTVKKAINYPHWWPNHQPIAP